MTHKKRPNFLIIVADDLGYSDLGCFGSEIQTPNLDKLARQGLRFTDFHAAAACSPTRAMLLSGTDSHLSGVGIMSEQRGWDLERWNKRGHEGYLNFDVAALPELLQDAGYHTLMSGKWHLGLREDNNPAVRGFDKSFALLPGCSNHYGFEPQFEGPATFFERIPPLYTEDGTHVKLDANTTNEYDQGFYSTDYYANNLIRYFNERTDAQEAQPFFAFLPFSAPHWPLQCSPEDRKVYEGWYDDGPEALRQKRLERLKALGIINRNVIPADIVGPKSSEWEEMTAEEKELSARSMECYAGMVHSIDRNCGRVCDYLEKTGELDNTFVIFMSDNGAEGAALEAHPVLGPKIMDVIEKLYDNSLENVGNHNSFVWYGPRWAQASTAPSRLYKMFTTEGGIRVPIILRYPPKTEPHQGKLVDAFSTVMDIAPTILELAGVTHPAHNQKTAMFRGREVYGTRGKSWASFLTTCKEGTNSIHTDDDPAVGWELMGKAALRKGKWKMVNMPLNQFGKAKWELYDLSVDPGEMNDLADTFPQEVEQLVKLWDQYVEETGVVWGGHFDESAVADWDHLPEDSIGGDPLGETKAWMTRRKVPLTEV